MVKMFVDQIAMNRVRYRVSLSATSRERRFVLVASLFSIVFYLVVLYTVGWDIGARDKIKIDGGRMREMPAKGFLIALGANSINILLALLIGLGILINTEWAGNISVVCNAIARLIQGMYLGVIKLAEDALFADAVHSGRLVVVPHHSDSGYYRRRSLLLYGLA